MNMKYRGTFALALWLIGSLYFTVNLIPTRLLVEMSSDAQDSALLFYSANGDWTLEEARSMPVFAGWDRVTFTLPLTILGNKVRFDPGTRATTYRIFSITWLRGGWKRSIALDGVSSPLPNSTLTLTRSALLVNTSSGQPELIVPTPDWTWTIASGMVPFGILLTSALLALVGLRRNCNPVHIAAAFLAACALLYVCICLRSGPTLPYYDDWRYLYPGPSNVIDGGWQWLTVVSNDTYFVTNEIIDWLVLKVSNVDFFWLRTTALAILLAQLCAQYRVISRVAGAHPAVAAIAVASGIWSLASAGYWGGTAIAYQQALPTLFGTLCLAHLCATEDRLNERFSITLLVVLSLAGGLAYISGGLLLLCLGVALLFNARATSGIFSGTSARAGWILSTLGAGCLILQVFLVSHQQGSLLDHNHAVSSVYPNDQRFWLFFFAVYGRALGYTGQSPLLDALLASIALAPGVVLGIRSLAGPKEGTPRAIDMWATLALYATIGSATYAAIVAFGRAGFIPATSSVADIVTFGKSRFHYWPVATMLPYVWLGWARIAHWAARGGIVMKRVIACALLVPKSLSAFEHNGALLYVQTMEKAGARCIVAHLSHIDSGKPVACPLITGSNVDIGPALVDLRRRDSPLYRDFMREGGLASYKDAPRRGGIVDPIMRDDFDEPR